MTEKTKYRLSTIAMGVLLAILAMLLLGALLRRSLPEAAPPESTPAAPTAYTLETYAAERGYALSDWPETLRELYDKNPDARPFVLAYPEKKNLDPAIDLTAEVTPGEIPALYQWDERWGYRTYNGDLFALTGCGPTTLSMAVIGLTGNTEADPWTLARYAEEHHYNVPDNGTLWSFIPEAGAAFGLHTQVLGLSEPGLLQELEAGRLLICCVGPGDFTDNGHFLLITGADNGFYRIHDPNSASNTEALWTYDRLVSQIKGLWTVWAA